MRAVAGTEGWNAVRSLRAGGLGVWAMPGWAWGCAIGLWLGLVTSWPAEVGSIPNGGAPARPGAERATNEPPSSAVPPAAGAGALASSNLLGPRAQAAPPAPRKDARLGARFHDVTA